MRNKLLVIAIFVVVISLHAQDKFKATQLTFDPAQEGFPTWSPDGNKILYQHTDMRDSPGKNGLWKIASDGTGAEQIFKAIAEHAKWSPDGRFIVFDTDIGNSIKMIPANGGEAIKFLPDSVFIQNGGLPCWSPDGKRIAFTSTRSGNFDIWIMEVDVKQLKKEFRELNEK